MSWTTTEASRKPTKTYEKQKGNAILKEKKQEIKEAKNTNETCVYINRESGIKDTSFEGDIAAEVWAEHFRKLLNQGVTKEENSASQEKIRTTMRVGQTKQPQPPQPALANSRIYTHESERE